MVKNELLFVQMFFSKYCHSFFIYFLDRKGVQKLTMQMIHFAGKLKWSRTGGEEMLPKNNSLPCASSETTCFASGMFSVTLMCICWEAKFQAVSEYFISRK